MEEIKKELPAKESSISTIPENTPIVNDYDIDAFLEKRKEFIEKVNAIMVEGSDYHVINGKKSLAKGGAEKIASIFAWQAAFTEDETARVFKIDSLISFKCTLTKNGVFVGEGRGAAALGTNRGDPNKTIKMAQKSAFIDAVLRASGLSDFFTQDLEDHPEHLEQEVPKATEKQKKFIADLMEQKGYTLEDLADNGIVPGQTAPSEVIEFLKGALSHKEPNGKVYFDSDTYLGDRPNQNEPIFTQEETDHVLDEPVYNDSPAKAKLRAKFTK